MNKTDEYICNDDGVLEKVRAIRNMTDEEVAEYIKNLKKSEEEV